MFQNLTWEGSKEIGQWSEGNEEEVFYLEKCILEFFQSEGKVPVDKE